MDDKRLLRAGVLSARTAMSERARELYASAIAEHGVVLCRGVSRVAAYAAVGTEPGTRQLLDRLRAAGVRVLLPTVQGQDLGWGDYVGWDALGSAAHRLLEPPATGAAADAASSADIVLAPALAVDRDGHRLGRGGGYYDRWLAGIDPAVPRVAVVYADEIVDHVPHELHDIAMTAALTPSGVIRLGERQ
ncbi:MAG TPA: 5-formyltetrahydrofolate cyclo-ligase [Mycobacteriales bacterium]|nr:5-formyltetrahydrofolate cyclo-ligase [Mycobacteriales bacterium]